jgi:hypothetical protein
MNSTAVQVEDNGLVGTTSGGRRRPVAIPAAKY